jgi:hypothetical protein
VGARPSLFATRFTWVSTGIVGWFAENRRTTSAVLGPTPGKFMSVFLASSIGSDSMGWSVPLYFSRIIRAACFMALALFL